MPLIEINRDPTDRQLRQFGGVCLLALPAIGWLWGTTTPTIGVLAGIGLVVAAISFALPGVVRPLFIGVSLVTAPIGLVLGELALLIVYYGVFLPIGLLFRLTRRDALQLRQDRDAETYWQVKAPPKNTESYFRQF